MNPKPQLIEACKKGDRKAQEELYKQCFSPLISICFRFANNKDDAAILLNEAFFKILQNIEKQNPNIPFMAWTRRITVNHCINEYRKDKTRKKYIETTDDETLSRHSDLEIDLDDSGEYSAEVLEIVKKEILNLPATTQEVFQLFILDGLSHKEIADSLGMQEGTSKWHVNNARKKLKEVLKGTLKIISSLVL